jgi:protocatechuate 3,4-dioxygenase beta subunit
MKFTCILLAAALLGPPAWAQTVSLKGQVTDESGALVPGATVSLSGPGGSKAAVSGADGSYSFADLQPGAYTLRASAPGLTLPQPQKTNLRAGAQTRWRGRRMRCDSA